MNRTYLEQFGLFEVLGLKLHSSQVRAFSTAGSETLRFGPRCPNGSAGWSDFGVLI